MKGRILQQSEEYEIELEYIGGSDVPSETIKQVILENTQYILSILQKSPIIMSLEQKHATLQEYKNLIIENRRHRLIQKLEQIRQIEYDDSDPVLVTLIPNEIEKLEKILSKLEKLHVSRSFVGPKPYTLELDSMRNIKGREVSTQVPEVGGKTLLDKIPPLVKRKVPIQLVKQDTDIIVSIRKSYSATDKADGERTLLFIDSVGRSFLLTSDMSIRVFPLELNPEYANTLLDGEFVNKGKGGTKLQLYLAFDIYIEKGVSVQDLPLNVPPTDDITQTRYKKLGDCINSISKFDRIRRKTFFFCSNGEEYPDSDDIWLKTIEEVSDNAYSQALQKEYNVDGLILTPIYLPVGSNGNNVLGYTLSPEDDDYRYDSISGRWSRVLKWKPSEENSIDFFVISKKTRDGRTPFISNGFKTLLLYVGVNPQDKNVIKDKFPCAQDSSSRRFASNFKLGTDKMLFSPKFYNYQDIYQAKVPVDTLGLVVCIDGKKS